MSKRNRRSHKVDIVKLGWKRVTLEDGKRYWVKGKLTKGSRADVELYEQQQEKPVFMPEQPSIKLDIQDSTLGSRG